MNRWIVSKYNGYSRGTAARRIHSNSAVTNEVVNDHQLLHIDSSVLGGNSASRALSAEIVARQAALYPGLKVTHRDLAADKGAST